MKRLALILLLGLCAFSAVCNEKDSLTSVLKTLKKHDTLHINVLNRLSYLTVADDSAMALQYLQHAMDDAHKLKYAKGQIMALYNHAYIKELNFNYKDAAVYFEKGIALSKKEKLPILTGYGYQDYALILKKQSLHKQSLQYNDSALAIYTALKDSAKMATLYTNIGNNYKNINLFEKAISYHLKSLKFAQAKNNYRSVARAYNNIALIYERNGDHENALQNYLKMEAPALRSGDQKTISVCYGNIGAAYQNLKQHEKALHYLSLAKRMNELKGLKQEILINLTNMASSLNSLKRYSEGLQISNEAIELSKEITDEESYGYACMSAGVAQRGLKNYVAAEQMLQEAITVAKKIENNPLLMISQEEIAILYETRGNYAAALAYFRMIGALKDSMYSTERHEQIASLQTQYEAEQKDKEIAEKNVAITLNELQIEKKNKLLIAAFLIVTALVFSIILMLKNTRLRQQKLKQEAALIQAKSIAQMQEEKLRISRELHDNIGSQLTFINTSLQSLTQGATGNEVLRETQTLTLNTIRELRNTVWLINKEEFTIDEFAVKLHDYAKTLHINGIDLQLKVEGATHLKLKALAASHLFRMVQEAINNILKHSGASQIRIQIDANDTTLQVRVKDNGRGFDLSDSLQKGYGLQSMKSRATELGGDFSISSLPNQGTTIYIKLPLA